MDYYKLLGVSINSSDSEIKSAYYALVRKTHPDRFSPNTIEWTNANHVLSELNQAYSILKDADKRQEYNATLVNNFYKADTVNDFFRKASQQKNNQKSQTTDTRKNPNPWDPEFYYNPNEYTNGSKYDDKNKKSAEYRPIGCIVIIVVLFMIIIAINFILPQKNTRTASIINKQPTSTSRPLSSTQQNRFRGTELSSNTKYPGGTWIPLEEEVPVEQMTTSSTMPIQELPANARYSNATGRKGEARFQILSSGTGYYFIKLVEIGTNKAVKIFVHAGKPLEVEIPLGKYEMRYAYGNIWYGEEYLFGLETVYTKSDTIFSFEKQGNRISGYTVTLYKVLDGNMRTREITAAEF